MLSYVFWHVPAGTTAAGEYEESLTRFHVDLAAGGGAAGSCWSRIEGVPWLAGSPVYEDWYLVEDFAALGRLNQAAVDLARRPSHDSVAALAGEGTAGLYGLVASDRLSTARPAPSRRDAQALWFAKPRGMSYADLVGSIEGEGRLWQRRMTLGPTPEFCLEGPAAVEPALHPATAEPRTLLTRCVGWHSA